MINLTNTSSSQDGRWSEIRSRLKARWSKLNHAEIEALKDNLGLLSTQLTKRYGFSDDFAQRESETFMNSLSKKMNDIQIEKDNPNIHEMKNPPKAGDVYG